MKLLQRIHSIWAFLVFSLIFLIFFPGFFVIIQNPRWRKAGVKLNHWWATLFFILSGIPYRLTFKSKLDKDLTYVFCANHASYLDIPSLGLSPLPFTFVGKSSIQKVPVFGYMYRNLHITVDRSSLKDRYKTLLKAENAIRQGHNVAIYAEGGILSEDPPNLARFKDGPFRLAITTQVPLVPVTIPYNWIILPDDGRFLLKAQINPRVEVIFHEPIETKGMSLDQVDELKDAVYEIIDCELKARNQRGSN